MKARKKARQRKRRALALAKRRRREEESEDKCFAAALSHDLKNSQLGTLPPPHCEWNGTEFVPRRPKPSPKVEVNVAIMHVAHRKFGIQWKGSRRGAHKSRRTKAVADSGCQTCSAGTDVLEQIGCPIGYLVPTSHRIIGITDDSLLDIMGSVLLRLEVAGKVTRQMVHVSKNTRGLYLSETALKELGLLPQRFPEPPISSASASDQPSAETTENAAACSEEGTPCIKRTPTPSRPETMPFPPTKENQLKLEE